jgi:hypothetical protein
MRYPSRYPNESLVADYSNSKISQSNIRIHEQQLNSWTAATAVCFRSQMEHVQVAGIQARVSTKKAK